GHRRYAMWFNESVRFAYDEGAGHLSLHVPSQFVCDWIGKNFRQDILETATEVTGRSVTFGLVIDQGLVEVAQRLLEAQVAEHDGAGAAGQAAAGAGSPRPATASLSGAGSAGPSGDGRRAVHPMPLRFRLNTFVVGASNEFAYSTAMRLVDEDPYA